MSVAPIARRVTRHARERGVLPVLADCTSWGLRWAAGRPRAGRPGSVFEHEGRSHRYLRHPYNYTWLNERAVEIPLATAVLDDALAAGVAPQRVLEVGNVLGHYRPVRHRVVDRYERAPGVENVDVVDIDPDARFDLILSISTLEHVGFDEPVTDPGKPLRALEHLGSLLAPGGRLWCTFPTGYNPALDEGLRAGTLGFDRLTALRRTGRDNRWVQMPVSQVEGVPYEWLLYTAHAVVVAEKVRTAP